MENYREVEAPAKPAQREIRPGLLKIRGCDGLVFAQVLFQGLAVLSGQSPSRLPSPAQRPGTAPQSEMRRANGPAVCPDGKRAPSKLPTVHSLEVTRFRARG